MVQRYGRMYHSGFILASLTALLIYGFTAFRTITWWDASEYIITAATLGVPHPPGSLLLVLTGWMITRLISGIAPAFLLNLLAGAFAAGTILGAGYVRYRLLQIDLPVEVHENSDSQIILTITGCTTGMLIVAFSETLWSYAVKFTPYILTGFFTILILWALLRWWEEADSHRSTLWLFLIALLFGLDFAVHRTNWLLLPGLLPWILLRRSRTLFSPKAWGAGVGGLAAGLSVLFLIIPMAAREPLLNLTDPSHAEQIPGLHHHPPVRRRYAHQSFPPAGIVLVLSSDGLPRRIQPELFLVAASSGIHWSAPGHSWIHRPGHFVETPLATGLWFDYPVCPGQHGSGALL